MNGRGLEWRRAGLLGGTAATLLVATMGLGGCVSTTSTSEADTSQMATTVDTDVRRRARIRLELAANYLQSGQTNVALDEIRQALAADPTFVDAYHLRGLIYMQMNDLNQAEESLNRALGMRANDPDIMHNLGWLLCQKEQYARAEAMFDKALAVPTYQDRNKTQMSKGVCLVRAGKPDQAEPILTRAYELDAGNPILGYEVAKLKFDKGDLKRSQFYMRRLNSSNFATADSLWLGIKVERGLGDHAAVRQLAEQLRRRFPDSRQMLAYERGAFNE
ncbi:type IV pilus biogenesis/stability protein PilW [Diaphorobacter aerolatus]|uniref:Type IV pilus biogenesis/stability protein PilW n=1 Tax=Diaphorobacter aerolatus TaxID=1288495 RepID=A0A7H0GIL1_9BURK|nr:type IV pilus biogenesis/stability protein PilW [Diaphorobacter aerolatus]QNP48127.1 type IV pilus biogenesis/stability protein PilW [Diaphorobacter aerolatus]